MRILAIIILALFAGGAYMLSRYVEESMDQQRRYGSDELIRAIRMHNEQHKDGVPYDDAPQTNTTRQVIQFGGKGVEVIPTDEQKAHTTYYNNDGTGTNEGQPGQPMPLTGQAPMNPVYK